MCVSGRRCVYTSALNSPVTAKPSPFVRPTIPGSINDARRDSRLSSFSFLLLSDSHPLFSSCDTPTQFFHSRPYPLSKAQACTLHTLTIEIFLFFCPTQCCKPSLLAATLLHSPTPIFFLLRLTPCCNPSPLACSNHVQLQKANPSSGSNISHSHPHLGLPTLLKESSISMSRRNVSVSSGRPYYAEDDLIIVEGDVFSKWVCAMLTPVLSAQLFHESCSLSGDLQSYLLPSSSLPSILPPSSEADPQPGRRPDQVHPPYSPPIRRPDRQSYLAKP